MNEIRVFLAGRSVGVNADGQFIWSPDLDVFWEPMTHDEVAEFLKLVNTYGPENCNN